MKIAIASDHGGYEVKNYIKKWLEDQNYTLQDFGAFTYDPNDDYPDFALPAALSVSQKENDLGIVLCRNGVGVCIAANKVKGIKAALVYNEKAAHTSKKDDNANVLCLGADEFSQEQLLRFIKIWLETQFEGGKYERRLQKIEHFENNL